mmetsp:Transcript_27770/g.66926  ORF Transcript_27770/g.66926 Transcript_27770/m.66926 type:complete len:224 (-) Transcript_27770:228-899(-)
MERFTPTHARPRQKASRSRMKLSLLMKISSLCPPAPLRSQQLVTWAQPSSSRAPWKRLLRPPPLRQLPNLRRMQLPRLPRLLPPLPPPSKLRLPAKPPPPPPATCPYPPPRCASAPKAPSCSAARPSTPRMDSVPCSGASNPTTSPCGIIVPAIRSRPRAFRYPPWRVWRRDCRRCAPPPTNAAWTVVPPTTTSIRAWLPRRRGSKFRTLRAYFPGGCRISTP